MKKILIIIILLTVVSCTDSKPKAVRKIDHMLYLKLNNPLQYEIESHGCKTWEEYMDTVKSELKDWPFPNANGRYILMRSDDPVPPDTIVDGIGYRRD